MTKGDFSFALIFYENLIDRSYNFRTAFDFNTLEDKVQLFIKIEQALKAFLYQEDKNINQVINYLAENYQNFEYSLNEIQQVLLGGKKTLTSEALFSDIVIFKGDKSNEMEPTTVDVSKYEIIHEKFRKKLLYNYFVKYYEETIFNLDEETKQILDIKSIEQNKFLIENKNFDDKEKEKYQKQYDIIKKIDDNKLWNSNIFQDKPVSNLRENICKYLEKEIESLEYIQINENFMKEREKFYSCCSGTSSYITIADTKRYKLQKIENNYLANEKKDTRTYTDIQKECDILYDLFSGSGWYAKEEARALYNVIHELAWYKEQNNEDKQKKKEEAILKLHLYFYALYKNNTMENPYYMDNLSTVTEFDDIINQSRKLYRKSEENKFTEQMNGEDLKIDMQDIETLFMEEKKKKVSKEGTN